MKTKSILLAFSMAILSAWNAEAKSVLDDVDPFIGTTNFSVNNPGAVCPHGMMSVVPFNVMGSGLNEFDKDARWWSAPYEYNNSYFTGFAHVALSGVGCPELGSLLLMPTTGALSVDYHEYGSEYEAEKASPGYYTSRLKKYGIKTEVTSTLRSSRERYTFPKGESHLLLNLGQGLTNETGGQLHYVNETEIEGMRMMGTFCYNPQAVFPMYFVLRLSKAPKSAGFYKKQPNRMGVKGEWDPDNGKYKLYKGYQKDIAGDDIGAFFDFDTEENEQIEVSVGVSFVSIKNARENLEKEQKGMNFDAIVAQARQQWEESLGRITVEGGTPQQRRIFYTALYHAQMHPNILQDVNGEYPEMENQQVGRIPSESSTGQKNRYTVFSLWDTYRNVHQLMTLVYPDRQLDMVRSMIQMYKEWGWMPKWELYGRETWTMEGDPSIPVITDTWLKGLNDFDILTAYEAFTKSADLPDKQNRMRPDNTPYIEKGYVPMNYFAADLSGDNSVSHALEYYIADYALSLLADNLAQKANGKEGKAMLKADARKYMQRALGYKHYYSKESGTLRPINKDGSFYSPFNPEDGANFSNAPGFHEGSAWNYTFYVPHDVMGLARLMGGRKAFVDKLQMVFDRGLYDPANEPDIAYPYLFSYFKGEEWRTQKEVARLLNKYYKDTPDGIPGNDDTGTMSAWAIFSMMGFYPDCPGAPYYTLTTPVFDRVTIHTDRNFYPSDIVIEAHRTSPSQQSIASMTLGGKKLSSYRISHEQLTKGAHLVIQCK
ncbi:MAG: GH92 family glycosyl hydrolase [Prevotella sp.]|nr:GH92 family glycosyl hydrolase [Prevotella sp.]